MNQIAARISSDRGRPKAPVPNPSRSGSANAIRREQAGPEGILDLQRSVGNSATAAMLRSPSRISAPVKPSVQRDDGTPPSGSQDGGQSSEWPKQREEMEQIRANATARQSQAVACVGFATNVLSSLKARLEACANVYSRGYERYANVVYAAQQAAKSEEEWLEIGVGILMAVALANPISAVAEGLGVEAGLAEATGSEAAAKLLTEAGKEAVVSGGAELVKGGVKQTGLLEVAGSTMEPGGLKPEVVKLQLWEKLVNMHGEVLATIDRAGMQSMIASAAEYAIGEIKAQMSGGSAADLDVPSLHSLIGDLAAADAASASIDARLSSAITALQGIQASLGSAACAEGREDEMERDIWLMWMAELPDDEAKILDIDAIEDHLISLGFITSYYGNGGSLGVDTGIFTTKNDCLKIIEAAKGKAEELKAKYTSLTG